MQGVKDVINEALRKTQCSKAALARKLGMSDDALSGWQRGDVRRLDIINLVRLCELAEVSMDALFCLQGKGTVQGSDDVGSLRQRAERAEWMIDQLRGQAQAPQTQSVATPAIPLGEVFSGERWKGHGDQKRMKLRRKLERATLEALLDAQIEVDKYTVPKKQEKQPDTGDLKHG